MCGRSLTQMFNSLAAMVIKRVGRSQSSTELITGRGRASLKSVDGHDDDRQYN